MNNPINQTHNVLDTLYTSSAGKTSRLGDLPLPYLRNILNKMQRDGDRSTLANAVAVVVDIRAAEVDAAMQERGETPPPPETVNHLLSSFVFMGRPQQWWEEVLTVMNDHAIPDAKMLAERLGL